MLCLRDVNAVFSLRYLVGANVPDVQNLQPNRTKTLVEQYGSGDVNQFYGKIVKHNISFLFLE